VTPRTPRRRSEPQRAATRGDCNGATAYAVIRRERYGRCVWRAMRVVKAGYPPKRPDCWNPRAYARSSQLAAYGP